MSKNSSKNTNTKNKLDISVANNKQYNGFNLFNHKLKILFSYIIFLSISIFSIFHFGFNKGIDFAGGMVIEAICEENHDISNITKQIKKKLQMPVVYQKMDNGYLFKINATKDHDKITSIFNTILSQNNIKIASSNFTSPQMTKVFIKDSIFACLFAFICIGLYIIIRFNWKFALSAIITLITDVLAVISFISVKQIEVCLVTLTAILTIIGYCINDKIIIFDRIKNNLDLRNTSIKEIVKNSVKSVIYRSLLTSITTIVVAISLLFFDDKQIYELGITVIFGIIFGTISSIIIAPSILLALNIKHNRIVTEKDSMWYAS